MTPCARTFLASAGWLIAFAGHAASDVMPGAQPAPATSAESKSTGPVYKPVDWRTGAVIAAGVAGVAAYGMAKWWEDGFTGDFRTVQEGWFGQNTEFGGTDKLGHAYSTYLGTRGLTWAFQEFGHEPETARQLGAVTTFLTFAAIEVADGYSRKYKFSKEDLLMNAAGAGLGYVMDRYPALDELIDFRLLYRASKTPGQGRNWDPAGDYSGQTYLLAFKATGVSALRDRPVLRYLELAVGYRARGYERSNGQLVDPSAPRRDIYVGVSLNLSRILDDTVFVNRQGSWAQRITSGVLEVVQVPGTAALHGHQL